MAAEAQTRKELLIKHGLSEEVLTALEKTLEEFQTLVEQGAAGRMAHVGASAELVTVAEEVVQVVKVMNGLIRLWFSAQPELLAAWESASNVPGPFRSANGRSVWSVRTCPGKGGSYQPDGRNAGTRGKIRAVGANLTTIRTFVPTARFLALGACVRRQEVEWKPAIGQRSKDR